MFKNLSAYLQALEDRGELKRVNTPVSAELEITEIADRLVKRGGPAVLFERVEGSDFPLVTGLFGTRERTALALGVRDLDQLSERVGRLLEFRVQGGLRGLAGLLPKLRDLKGFSPSQVRSAPVQTVVKRGSEINLSKLPVQTCWPLDGGPFITLPLVITKDPETGDLNVGMYRMQVLDATSTAMHWQLHKVGRRHLELARALGQRLEVAVALGGDPLLIYAATAPLPPLPGVSEFNLAGFLRGRGVELARGVSVDLPVPAEAEFVLEGYVDPSEDLVTEGPFGDHTGFYTLEEPYPRFHITALTHRKHPLYPSTIVGRPPMEDAYLVEASERLFLPAARVVLPEIVDYHLPPAGVAHNWLNVAIRKHYPGQAYKVASGLLGLGQMMLAKVVVVTDHDVSPRPGLQALQKALELALPGRDTLITRGPVDVLDHSARAEGFGGKLIIDGTAKWIQEGGHIAFTPTQHNILPHHPGAVAQQQLPGIWLITLDKQHPDQARRLAQALAETPQGVGIRLMLLADADTNPNNPEEMLWSVLNNIDPGRDAWIIGGAGGPILALDGTRKLAGEGFVRRWPEKISMSPEIHARIDQRWPLLGLDEA